MAGRDSFPVEVPHPQIMIPLLTNTKSVLNLGGIWGTVGAGQTVMASDGTRFVWYADGMQVVYSVGSKFYTQSASGFAGEVRTAPFVEAGRRAALMAKVAEIEVKLLMGVVAGCSGVGFAAVIGTEVLQFIVENRDNFAVWNQQLQAVMKARSFLKTHTPVLYDKVFEAVLNQVYKDVKSQLPDAVTPEAVAFGIGVIIGAIGKKAAAGKLSLLAIIFAVMEQLVVRFSLSTVPEAIKLTKEKYAGLADEIIEKMKAAGVTLNKLDADKILEEVQKHPKVVKEAFDMLKGAFEQHVKAKAGQ
jgi:hypothetical protein